MELDAVYVALTEDWKVQVDETDDGRPVTRREYEDIDAFAQAVGGFLERPVLVEYATALPRTDRALLICEEDAVAPISASLSIADTELYPRLFFLNVELRPKSTRRVADLGGAGAIERMRYNVWRWEREYDPGGGVFGRKDVARKLGAHWQPSVLSETERYCFFEHGEHPTLPDLLAAYLLEYSALL